MTEYDYSPEALDAYNRTQQRIAAWVDDTEAHHHEFRPPFGARSDAGHSEQDEHVHFRPPIPHRRSISVGPPGVYNPAPSPPGLYPGMAFPHVNAPAPNPMPPQMAQMPANYSQYVSPPATIVPQNQGALHRSQSHDNLSHHSRQSEHHRPKHHSPAYVMQTSPTYNPPNYTSPTYAPVFSPPLSTAGAMWYPQQQTGYSFPHHATPPRVVSPTGVPYAYSYAPAAPNGVQYPYGLVQQPVQPQPQVIFVRNSKPRKSSRSRKVVYV